MSIFFILIEIASILLTIYLTITKRELVLLYLPALFFSTTVANNTLPSSVEYALFSGVVIYLMWNNIYFFKRNWFAILLFFLHFLLLPTADDFLYIRPVFISLVWFFLLVPLVMHIYMKYPRRVLIEELYYSAMIILCLFCANVAASTVFNYSPFEMYGIQSGVLYGNLFAADFNILTVALFVAFFYISRKPKLIPFLIAMVSYGFILLSMRRSVILICTLGMAFVLLILIANKQVKKVFAVSVAIVIIGILALFTTDIVSTFQHRYELRNLEERDLEGEARFAEYGLLYKDVFVYQDFTNPLLGREFLDSRGNYGKGIFGTRTLHGDITNIFHSTGLIGLGLYSLMVFWVFWNAFIYHKSRTDQLIILFCVGTFIMFTVTGRYTNLEFSLLFYLVLCLPLGKVRVDQTSEPTVNPNHALVRT